MASGSNDLRLRIYEHLHRLSLRYYDHAKIGALVSTITSDVSTIQDFASSSTLDIVIDLLTILFMVGLMFWLDWDFTLIAVAFTPVLLVFVFHFKKAVKEATRAVRVRQSEVLSIVQRGLGAIRVTKAFGRQDLELAHLEAASHATVVAALRARRIKSLMSPLVAIVVAICTAVVLWKGTSLIVAGTMTAGALTVYLAYLKKFFKPVKDLASMSSTIAQTTVALERIQNASRPFYRPMTSSKSGPAPSIPAASAVRSPSTASASAMTGTILCCTRCRSTSSRGRRSALSAQPVPANRRS